MYQKLGYAFGNAQQMHVQFAACKSLSLALYHSSCTFKFISTSPLKHERVIDSSTIKMFTCSLSINNIFVPLKSGSNVTHLSQTFTH